jgi:hypothetical protein
VEHDPNPYQAPGEEFSGDAFETTGEDSLPAAFRKRIGRGRWAILVIALAFALVAALSYCMFAYQAMYLLSNDEFFVISSPLWVLAHLLRGVALTVLAWQLWQYSRSIRAIVRRGDEAVEAFLDRHAMLWTWGAAALAVLVGYSVLTSVWIVVEARNRLW